MILEGLNRDQNKFKSLNLVIKCFSIARYDNSKIHNLEIINFFKRLNLKYVLKFFLKLNHFLHVNGVMYMTYKTKL
jgi:hypothetical protein